MFLNRLLVGSVVLGCAPRTDRVCVVAWPADVDDDVLAPVAADGFWMFVLLAEEMLSAVAELLEMADTLDDALAPLAALACDALVCVTEIGDEETLPERAVELPVLSTV